MREKVAYATGMTKDQAIRYFGSVNAVAAALRIHQSAVSQWIDVPLLRQLQIEAITSGKLKADESAKLPKIRRTKVAA